MPVLVVRLPFKGRVIGGANLLSERTRASRNESAFYFFVDRIANNGGQQQRLPGEGLHRRLRIQEQINWYGLIPIFFGV